MAVGRGKLWTGADRYKYLLCTVRQRVELHGVAHGPLRSYCIDDRLWKGFIAVSARSNRDLRGSSKRLLISSTIRELLGTVGYRGMMFPLLLSNRCISG
jgi:hypothetical protein